MEEPSRNQSLTVSGEVKHTPASCVAYGTDQSGKNFVTKQGHLTVDVQWLGEAGECFMSIANICLSKRAS